MTWIDWMIVLVPLGLVGWIGFYTRRHVHGVSDFLAGGRVAGRYVVAVASGEASLGLISVVAMFEMYYNSGFAIGFWNGFLMPIGLIIALTGLAVYRYRETRAMTLAQFLEVRYSRSFRVFAGALSWLAGVINYAVFPAVGARFIVYYGGLPPAVSLLGLQVPTFALVMAIFLSIAIAIVFFGGQLTAMVTDCVAGLFSYAMYAIVVVAVLWLFSWSQMRDALLDRPPGQSMLNPFDTANLKGFNVFYIVVGIIHSVYGLMAWQGSAGYNAAASSPHEQKMGSVLGVWRAGLSTLMVVLLAMAAYTFMHHPDFAAGASDVQHELVDQINLSNEVTTQTIRDQMTVPIAIKHFLPVGVTGAFFAVMVFLLISTDTTYLHSWGSIFVQDVMLPYRKKPLTPRRQMWWLRLSILSVAVFAFVFSLFFNQVSHILMFMALTGSIWLGGAGSVILGGLYWRRGTTSGAWAGLLAGATFAVLGFIFTQYWAQPIYPYLSEHHPQGLVSFKENLEWLGEKLPFTDWEVTPEKFPITGQEIYFLTMVVSIVSYVTASLLTCREPFNLEKMLHRGEYRRKDEIDKDLATLRKPLRNWKHVLLGFDEQYSRGDKIMSGSVFAYSMTLFTIFIAVVLWNTCISPFSDEGWATYFWIMNVVLALVVGAVTSVWFTIGGILDLRKMFRRLSTLQRNLLDDGRVVNHTNAEDLAFALEKSEDQQPPQLENPDEPSG